MDRNQSRHLQFVQEISSLAICDIYYHLLSYMSVSIKQLLRQHPPSSGKWAISAAAVCNHLANTSCPGQQCEQGNKQIGLTDLCGCIHTGTSLDQLRDNFYVPFFGSQMESIQPILI